MLNLLILIVSLFPASSKCENPKVKATSYTPSDAQVLTHIPFIAEFSLACSNGATNVLLYANINGALLPVVRSVDGTKYQVLNCIIHNNSLACK
jgi:translocon-associated protein subunit delta